MVFIKQQNNNILIAAVDNLLFYDTNNENGKCVKIPDPILPENLTKGQIEVLKKEIRTITTVAFSKNNQLLAVGTENKQLLIYNSNFEVIKNVITSRCASSLCFSPANDVLVADRTGDVYLYYINKEDSEPILLLGHLSVVLDILISECGKYIITCDRDEKIRISRFPNAYNIVGYCLGHKEFVIKLNLIKDILISASGDGTIRFWNYIEGKELGRINTNEFVENNKFLEDFSKEMDAEKVDVVALPIIDMNIYFNSGKLFVAALLHKCNSVQLYSTNLETCKSFFLRRFEMNGPIVSFSLGEHFLIYGNTLLKCFKLVNNENYQEAEANNFVKFLSRYKETLNQSNINDQISANYKRKFDNVQDYMERKRQRLQIK